ncbi:MAG: NUDIX domain-containing protein [Candidatus Taylorbacteria bacterium]|nr:NUDIX domain-containing protein [Candidatus Taylorbacteria bacterium]
MDKRHNSMLIPYRFKDGNLYVFLQRRSDDTPRNPDTLGGFGGGIEGEENNEEALLREMQEELEYTPKKHTLLGIFETDHSVSNYYIEEVNEDFEKGITVHEGKGGEWHKASAVIERKDISPNTRRVVRAILTQFLFVSNSQKV